MREINFKDASARLCSISNLANPHEIKFKINANYLKFNCYNAAECYRELMVSFFQMLPLLDKTVPFSEADYILYAHPYARIEDMSKSVIEQLQHIDEDRKDGAEIIVVGKAANVESLLNGSISNITFYEDHFTEKLGKRFGIDIKEEYFVYDSYNKYLNIWPVNGCLRKCKFCRRSYMNIPFESLSLETIKSQLDFWKEYNPKAMQYIMLRAENLTEYGIDIYGESRLHELIDLLNSYPEIKQIQIPIGLAICEITDQILESLCNCKKLIDIALNLETGSDRLLKLIGKDHSRNRAIHIFQEIRKAHPKIILRSTLMIGLPTEELIDIYELADLIEQTKPDSILCNYFGLAPKYPLAKLPQLSQNLKEYHLELFLHLLKKQKRKRELYITHERILKKGSRLAYRFERYAKYQLEKYSFIVLLEKRICLSPKD